ncbi:MAG: hypothetical protein KDB86_02510 [Actinobacteria bacterium]|nr:hypothetical protein [Actinomycetota bacterium]
MDIECPRCGQARQQPFYGPCAQCRADLRARLGSDPQTDGPATPRYEPKMNVTPNQVATKD